MDTLLGNNRIRTFLQQMIQKEVVPHALLFTGPKGAGKALVAREFAEQLAGKGPDVSYFDTYTIEGVREIINEAGLPPYQAKMKVLILDNAHEMNPQSANALLKTLEEPTSRSVFILIATSTEALLPTIVSRCRHFPFPPAPTVATESSKTIEAFVENLLAQTSLVEQLKLCQKLDIADEEADVLFEKLLHAHRTLPTFEKMMRLVLECRRALDHHVKLRTCLEKILLSL